MRALAPLATAVIGAILLAVIGTTPPAPKGLNSGPTEFSAARAMADVRRISARPHVTGSKENARVRGYIQARLESLGLEVRTTTGLVPEKSLKKFRMWSGLELEALKLTNVIGILPGRDRGQPALLLMTHHDTVWNSPGAAVR